MQRSSDSADSCRVRIKATYGTGSSLMTPIKDLRISERGLSSTVAWGLKDITYALEGEGR